MLQKIMIVILASFLLQACAKQQEYYRLDEGKNDFIDGNYKKAFHELLPMAIQGNTHAEYAVGYMYYYGFGVAQDSDSGITWMERAANHGSVPAQKALELIHSKPSNIPQPVVPATPNY